MILSYGNNEDSFSCESDSSGTSNNSFNSSLRSSSVCKQKVKKEENSDNFFAFEIQGNKAKNKRQSVDLLEDDFAKLKVIQKKKFENHHDLSIELNPTKGDKCFFSNDTLSLLNMSRQKSFVNSDLDLSHISFLHNPPRIRPLVKRSHSTSSFQNLIDNYYDDEEKHFDKHFHDNKKEDKKGQSKKQREEMNNSDLYSNIKELLKSDDKISLNLSSLNTSHQNNNFNHYHSSSSPDPNSTVKKKENFIPKSEIILNQGHSEILTPKTTTMSPNPILNYYDMSPKKNPGMKPIIEEAPDAVKSTSSRDSSKAISNGQSQNINKSQNKNNVSNSTDELFAHLNKKIDNLDMTNLTQNSFIGSKQDMNYQQMNSNYNHIFQYNNYQNDSHDNLNVYNANNNQMNNNEHNNLFNFPQQQNQQGFINNIPGGNSNMYLVKSNSKNTLNTMLNVNPIHPMPTNLNPMNTLNPLNTMNTLQIAQMNIPVSVPESPSNMNISNTKVKQNSVNTNSTTVSISNYTTVPHFSVKIDKNMKNNIIGNFTVGNKVPGNKMMPGCQNNNPGNNYSDLSEEELAKIAEIIARDQTGCRFLQKKIIDNPSFANEILFYELQPSMLDLINDAFGNYLIQKLIENLEESKIEWIIDLISPYFLDVSCSPHGTRVVQKIIENLCTEELLHKFNEVFAQYAILLSKDVNANHIVQKYLYTIRSPHNQFLYDIMINNLVDVSTDKHGCCVMQKVVDAADPEQRAILIEIILKRTVNFMADQYANYVIQFIIGLSDFEINHRIAEMFITNLKYLSKQKFSSNVIEKCFDHSNEEIQELIVNEMVKDDSLVAELIVDMYGNYVLQKALAVAKGDNYLKLLRGVGNNLDKLKTVPFGNKLLAKFLNTYKELPSLIKSSSRMNKGMNNISMNNMNNINNSNMSGILMNNGGKNMNYNNNYNKGNNYQQMKNKKNNMDQQTNFMSTNVNNVPYYYGEGMNNGMNQMNINPGYMNNMISPMNQMNQIPNSPNNLQYMNQFNQFQNYTNPYIPNYPQNFYPNNQMMMQNQTNSYTKPNYKNYPQNFYQG